MENDEMQEPQPVKKSRIISIVVEILIYAAIIFVCIFVIPKYVIQRTVVSGSSMEDTLQNHDNLLVEKVSYRFGDPKRFDIVIFYPHGKDEDEYYVKRVIGLPGETVQIIGPDIYIDGEILQEHYGKNPITYAGLAERPLRLEADEFFVLGDNREVSLDSRYDEVKPVHRDLIAGRAILRIWPLGSFGTIH